MACGFETVDYNGVPLICFHEQWEEHILDGHPEMDGQQAAVITALRDPHSVYLPAGKWTNRRLYYRPLVLRPPYTNYYLLAVVDYPTGESRYGRVVTAYPRKFHKKGDTLLWTKAGKTG